MVRQTALQNLVISWAKKAPRYIWGGALCGVLAGPAVAGPLGNACLRSDIAGVTTTLCLCIDDVAEKTLDRRDQRRAARFFADPDTAHDVRQSDNDSDEAFWQRYAAFSKAAADSCKKG